MGRTNIVIDDRLMKKAMKYAGARTKRETVEIALRKLVEMGSDYAALLSLHGRLPWEGDIDAWRRSRR